MSCAVADVSTAYDGIIAQIGSRIASGTMNAWSETTPPGTLTASDPDGAWVGQLTRGDCWRPRPVGQWLPNSSAIGGSTSPPINPPKASTDDGDGSCPRL
jgi:hypothetical protein